MLIFTVGRRSAVNFYLAGRVEFQPYLLARGDGRSEVCLGKGAGRW